MLEAANGRDAVEIASRERPDLLIIDLNMPEMDGYEAIANLRKDLSMATLPIMVLTSEEGPGIERRVLELGADDYMLKPFDPDVLLSRVNAVFRRLKVMAVACGCIHEPSRSCHGRCDSRRRHRPGHRPAASISRRRRSKI